MDEISSSLAKEIRPRGSRLWVKVQALTKIAPACRSSGAAGDLLSKMIKAMGEHAQKLGFPGERASVA